MKDPIRIEWPNGSYSSVMPGADWLSTANKAGVSIPTGCLTGSCGACEIEVNGKILRACVSNIPLTKSRNLRVEFISDPYW